MEQLYECPHGHTSKRTGALKICHQCRAQGLALYKERFPERMAALDRRRKKPYHHRKRAFKYKAYPRDPDERTTVKKKMMQLAVAEERYREAGIRAEIDHIIPLARGGLHVADNLRLLPAEQNQRKSDSLDEELDWAPTPLQVPFKRLRATERVTHREPCFAAA